MTKQGASTQKKTDPISEQTFEIVKKIFIENSSRFFTHERYFQEFYSVKMDFQGVKNYKNVPRGRTQDELKERSMLRVIELGPVRH